MTGATTQTERIEAGRTARRPTRAENVGSLLRPKRLLDVGEDFYEEGMSSSTTRSGRRTDPSCSLRRRSSSCRRSSRRG